MERRSKSRGGGQRGFWGHTPGGVRAATKIDARHKRHQAAQVRVCGARSALPRPVWGRAVLSAASTWAWPGEGVLGRRGVTGQSSPGPPGSVRVVPGGEVSVACARQTEGERTARVGAPLARTLDLGPRPSAVRGGGAWTERGAPLRLPQGHELTGLEFEKPKPAPWKCVFNFWPASGSRRQACGRGGGRGRAELSQRGTRRPGPWVPSGLGSGCLPVGVVRRPASLLWVLRQRASP